MSAVSSGRYCFRGLLRELNPRAHFGRGYGDTWTLTCWIDVPHRDTGSPFSVVASQEWEKKPSEEELHAAVRDAFRRLLLHEAEEGIGVDGVFADPHPAQGAESDAA